ncbi:MAG: GTP 3',8-cyclase MoaA [Rhodocyclaceae bacterium]|nr:GTP 3',8-cyclase MoaA [Rhodocyclaceae bacterium]MCA3023790.1 GTP 3',8-cyclase MoaA [Rhodocyclaceae bacterium]MCA3027206.1 GTP 3',8-cyclase MoaA [Rhodocyclaceae bacterium]MCA3030623.1 GTP 3',8-cyclase MoaA [Rhodocyclaceae bacterium]MCA3035777.1 GTP 3',8-cyclase MoaA [Rhodocyclaceae bacterium]
MSVNARPSIIQSVIPIADLRQAGSLPIPAHVPSTDATALRDQRGRQLRDLRISVTDRCNFRCTYCMPKEVFDNNYQYLPHAEVLSFEEITRVARIAVGQGVRKIRLTGGEPLMRRGIEELVAMLAAIPDIDLTLTTNGSALKAKAATLKAAGLNRLTVSLDSLDDKTFRAMNDVDFPVAKVLEAIDAANAAGFEQIKINMVVKRGVNDHQVVQMAKFFKPAHGMPGNIVRYIEFMDVGSTNGWKMDDVIPSQEVVNRIHAVLPCQPANPNHLGEVAKRWRYLDGAGEFGVISSVTEAFCGTCTRARLSTDGSLYTCLFAQRGYDLKTLLRSGADDVAIANAIAGIWQSRQDNYSEVRTAETARERKVEMSFIGG